MGWALVLAPLAIVILYEAGTRELAADWAGSQPKLAVAAQPNTPDALTGLAEAAYNDGKFDDAELLAKRALSIEPLDVDAIRILGWVAGQKGDGRRARLLLNLAGRLSRRDLRTQYWLYERARDASDYAAAVAHADAIMRQVPRYADSLTPELLELGQHPAGARALADALSDHPLWRPVFFLALGLDPGGPDPSPVLAAMVRSSSPPTDEELTPLLRRLVERQDYARAFSIWRSFSPARALYRDSIADGSFVKASGSPPFGWNFTSGVGFSAEVVPAAARPARDARGVASALRASSDGFSEGVLAEQLLMLRPGEHWLSGLSRVILGDGQKVHWTVQCAETGQTLLNAPGPATTEGEWERFRVRVVVPGEQCKAQWMRLATDPGERESDIELWYADLSFDQPPASAE